MIYSLMVDISYNSETMYLINVKVQEIGNIAVKEEILENKNKLREFTCLELEKIIILCKKDVKNQKIDRKIKNFNILKEDTMKRSKINESIEREINPNRNAKKAIEEDKLENRFNLKSFIPKNIFSVSNT